MKNYRKIDKIINGRVQKDGAGVKLQRVLAYRTIYDFDPFLMLDVFDSKDPDDYVKGFPWHPHRGIETITYLIKGKIEHMDSLGNKGVITDNYCQWMTAGSGILHQEMPLASERMLGFQLWLNLPKINKMTKPEYNDIDETKIPVIHEKDTTIKLISGNYKDTHAPTQGKYIKATIIDVELKANSTWEYLSEPENTLFLYILSGTAVFENDAQQQIEATNAVLFKPGEILSVSSNQNDLHFIVFSAKALKETIAWGGPIVMNTQEELDLAFAEIDKGTFLK